MSESVVGLAATKGRRDRLQGAVRDLDARIATMERRQNAADPADRPIIAREIRSIADQRSTAAELLAEAEAQHAAKRSQHEEAVATATRDLTRIGKACSDAAGRFDRAMRDALLALEDIEREAAPLENTLIPNGIRPVYTHARCINAAFAKVFQSRLGLSVAHADKISMGERVALMLSNARQNAAQHRKKKEAA